MKAWLWDGSQGISHLGLAETPNPVAKDGEAVMEVRYAALNAADRYPAEKVYPYPVCPPMPHVLGRDGMGTITQVGASVGLELGKPPDE
jgi:NADPH2:quinone reductase